MLPVDNAIELAAGVRRHGGGVNIDGRVSWAPAIPGHIQPANCYTIARKSGSVLIDTGIALHRESVLTSLGQAANGVGFDTFLTRTELDCTGNLGALAAAGRIARIRNAGAIGPFDAFPDDVERTVPLTVVPLAGGEPIEVEGQAGLFVIPAFIRMLSTVWLYDTSSRTLFSSDFFGHTALSDGRASPVLDSLAADETTGVSARAHLLAKFWWLDRAQTTPLRRWLAELFGRFPVEVIAPTHGCVLKGRDVVSRHFDLISELLRSMDNAR